MGVSRLHIASDNHGGFVAGTFESSSGIMRLVKPHLSHPPISSALSRLLPVAAALVLGACARPHAAGNDPAPADRSGSGRSAGGIASPAPAVSSELQQLYRRMGLIAGASTLPFVASVSFLHAPSADSTLTLLAMSIPSRALGFAREGEHYAASYTTRVELRQNGSVVRSIESSDTVRVPTFRETTRNDESIIWQQFMVVAPGRYVMTLSVRDESGVGATSEDVTLDVPPVPGASLASPVAVYEAIPRRSVDSLPRILARPRSSLVFGQDTVLPIYIDAVGTQSPSRIAVQVLGEADAVTWSDSIDLPIHGSSHSGTISIPVNRMDVGINTIRISIPGTPAIAQTRAMVSLGDDLPIANFDEMLSYLRYFTTEDRLNALRKTPRSQRAAAWAAFLQETDPIPGTTEHEGLRDYFARIRTANIRYRDDAQIGWLSDRGITYVALGDPDNLYDSSLLNPGARQRQQIWEYNQLRVQLQFIDRTGFGRWELTPQSRALLQTAIRQRLGERQPDL